MNTPRDLQEPDFVFYFFLPSHPIVKVKFTTSSKNKKKKYMCTCLVHDDVNFWQRYTAAAQLVTYLGLDCLSFPELANFHPPFPFSHQSKDIFRTTVKNRRVSRSDGNGEK